LQRLSTATVGLIGFGRIPQLVAKKLSGFGIRILAFDPWADIHVAGELGVTLSDLEAIYREADFISVHCPLTEDTKSLIGLAAMKKMKKTAFIINTARGGIIDEAALIAAIESGEIAGAGLDVFECEPLAPDSKLLRFDNVNVTPHSAWYSETAVSTLQRKVAEEVVNVLNGNYPFNPVNMRRRDGETGI
jgi:D-3-phosphoglycerate dehydrogenase